MYGKQEAVQRHSVSLAWRLDREMRRRLFLHETKRVYSLNVFYFILYRRSLCTAAPHLKKSDFFEVRGGCTQAISTSILFTCFWIDLVRVLATTGNTSAVAGYTVRVYTVNTRKFKGLDSREITSLPEIKKVIKNGTSFQSSPKINRMLITSAYSESLQHPNIAVLLIKILLLIFFLTTQKCSLVPK